MLTNLVIWIGVAAAIGVWGVLGSLMAEAAVEFVRAARECLRRR